MICVTGGGGGILSVVATLVVLSNSTPAGPIAEYVVDSHTPKKV